VPGQLRVEDKSNEIPAVAELLAVLALDGCIVTTDALHCQNKTATAILELARLRRFALNVLRANRAKGSTRGKIKRAGWDDAFLLQLLASA
jgi:predicted transposase YbfD/YdcC